MIGMDYFTKDLTIYVDEVGDLPRLDLINLEYLSDKIVIIRFEGGDKVLHLWGKPYCGERQ